MAVNDWPKRTNSTIFTDPGGPLAELTAPAAYAADRGWDQELPWVREGAETAPVAVAPGEVIAAAVAVDIGLPRRKVDGQGHAVRDLRALVLDDERV